MANVAFRAVDSQELGAAWAGARAGFDLYTHGDRQFVAFFDAERNLTVGGRTLGESDWTTARLPEERTVGLDSHNDLELAVDSAGHLHLSGNMHVHPLKYFRTTDPLDVTTFERVEAMVGSEEDRVTYPQFVRGPDGELAFIYRHGHSGNGVRLVNVYDPETREWRRLLDEPLLSGRDRMNAYPHGPVVGPEGDYHLCFVWRDHGGAQTNHDMCYARSPDLRNWETSQGSRRDLPMTVNTADLVDPVPPYGGMINSNQALGFDAQGRPIVTYTKFDRDGDTQAYNARAEAGGWEIYETSDWDYRWTFGGGGALGGPEVSTGPVEVESDGRLSQTYDHVNYGSGKWILEEETLQPTEWYSPWFRYPPDLAEPDGDALTTMWAEDSGESPGETTFALRWEAAAGADLDRESAPPPSTLGLYEFEKRDWRV